MRSSRKAVRLLLAVLALCLDSAARADPFEEGRLLSANPDTPSTGLSWRDYLHGSAGADVRFLAPGPEGGWVFDVPAMVELANDRDDPAPSDYWRGLLALHGGYRLGPRRGLPEGIELALEVRHESDHETRHSSSEEGTPYGFYQLNSVSLYSEAPFHVYGQEVVASFIARFHVATCTSSVSACPVVNGGDGSRTFEALGEVVWTGAATPALAGHWRPALALFADGLVPNGVALEEHRFVAQAGAWVHLSAGGYFQVFGLGWLGSDVGYLRHDRVKQLGAGIRWSP
jgi:hypothetical protein